MATKEDTKGFLEWSKIWKDILENPLSFRKHSLAIQAIYETV